MSEDYSEKLIRRAHAAVTWGKSIDRLVCDEALDMDTVDRDGLLLAATIGRWLPAKVLEPSSLRNVFWVRITYPNGTTLERPRNLVQLRMSGEGVFRRMMRRWQLRRFSTSKWSERGWTGLT